MMVVNIVIVECMLCGYGVFVVLCDGLVLGVCLCVMFGIFILLV